MEYVDRPDEKLPEEKKIIMKKLIEVLKEIEDMDFLIAELEACGDECEVETIDDLAAYLKSALSDAN